MPEGLLSELTILDLTEGAGGPFCTKLFADYGARVIKVERPGRGDPARRVGPFPPGPNPSTSLRAGPEAGVLFLYLNTGKESITLDLTTATGRRPGGGLRARPPRPPRPGCRGAAPPPPAPHRPLRHRLRADGALRRLSLD